MAIDLFNKVNETVSDIRRTRGEINTELAPIRDGLSQVNAGINAFKDISAQIGQLKANPSISQVAQLTGLSGLSGIASEANKIAGNVTNMLSNIDNTQSSVIAVAGNLANALNNSGMATNTIKDIVTKNISPSIINRTTVDVASSATPTDLGKLSNRLPRAAGSNPIRTIQKSKQNIIGEGGEYFPKDLGAGTTKSWIKLHVEKYNKEDPFIKGNLQPLKSIYLPLPKSLAELFSVNYESKDIGVVTGGIAKAGGDEADAFIGQISSVIENARAGKASETDFIGLPGVLAKTAEGIDSQEGRNVAFAKLQDLGTSALAGLGGEGIAGLADRMIGGVPNPHSTVFFKGMNLRTFTWNWYLVPRSEADSESLLKIMDALKRATLPNIDGAILTYPDLVTPSIVGENKINMKFKRCMVGDLGIDYTPDAQAFHTDGAPVSCNLSITFKEIELFTERDI
jgi:hypothetical protein